MRLMLLVTATVALLAAIAGFVDMAVRNDPQDVLVVLGLLALCVLALLEIPEWPCGDPDCEDCHPPEDQA